MKYQEITPLSMCPHSKLIGCLGAMLGEFLLLLEQVLHFLIVCNTKYFVATIFQIFKVANLAGSLNGTNYGDFTVLFGGAVDGPSDVSNFDGLGVPGSANACPSTAPYTNNS